MEKAFVYGMSVGGSKKHLMENIFQSRRMPFYQFGEMTHLKCIPTEYWVPFICSRFEKYGKKISEAYAGRICQVVKNYSSYVQQLAWNVMAETEKEVNEESFEEGLKALLEQSSGLFIQQTEGLTTYQLNFIRLCAKAYMLDLPPRRSQKHTLWAASQI